MRQSARSPSASVPQDVLERRAFVHYPARLNGYCSLLGGRDKYWLATVRDLSRDGLALVLAHEVQPGHVLYVALSEELPGVPQPLRARVRRVSPQTDGTWIVGCQFVRILSEEQLQTLLG